MYTYVGMYVFNMYFVYVYVCLYDYLCLYLCMYAHNMYVCIHPVETSIKFDNSPDMYIRSKSTGYNGKVNRATKTGGRNQKEDMYKRYQRPKPIRGFNQR